MTVQRKKIFTYAIAGRISPFMRSRGFKRKGKRFYKIQNDIAFCIDMEMPTAWVYVWAYIIPLYMPSDVVTLSYGTRLGNLPKIMLPDLSKYESEEKIEAWCQLLCSRIEDTILPIFSTIDTPKKLAAFVEGEKEQVVAERELFHCSLLHLDELLIYTYLYLRDWEHLDAPMKHYPRELMDFPILPESRKKRLDWLQQIQTLRNSDDDRIAAYFLHAKEMTGKLFP